MAIILNLLPSVVWQSITVGAQHANNDMSPLRAQAIKRIKTEGSGCCKGCPLFGLCDNDECAAKGFPIDSPAPSTLFPNLGVYIDYLKKQGWR